MNRRFWILFMKIFGAFFLSILIIFCVSDEYLKQEKTVFEGWERPVFTEEGDKEILPKPETTEFMFEYMTENQPIEESTKIEQLETKEPETIENETQKDVDIPTVKLKKIHTENADIKEADDYMIELSLPEKIKTFGVLFMIYTENDGNIMEFSVFDVPSQVKITNLVEGGVTYILIDGIKKNDESAFCFSAKIFCDIKNEKISLKLLDFKMMT